MENTNSRMKVMMDMLKENNANFHETTKGN